MCFKCLLPHHASLSIYSHYKSYKRRLPDDDFTCLEDRFSNAVISYLRVDRDEREASLMTHSDKVEQRSIDKSFKVTYRYL
jgi:hypothetical protein